VSIERNISEYFVGVNAVTAQQLLAIEAVTDFSALFLANPTADLTSIGTLLDSEKTEQAIVMKTGRQLIKLVSFGDINLCLTLGTAKLTISLVRQRVSFQTLTTERVKTRYGLRLGESIQANRTFDMFS